MNKREKFQKLVSKNTNNTLARNKERIENRAMLRESRDIALKVLLKLDELGWSQKDLAEKMEVTPQQVNKLVKGKENLTLTTITKLQEVLGISILASSYETLLENILSKVFNTLTEQYEAPMQTKGFAEDTKLSSKIIYASYVSEYISTYKQTA